MDHINRSEGNMHSLKKCKFPGNVVKFPARYYVSLYPKSQKFPSKWQNFLGMTFPNSPFFRAMQDWIGKERERVFVCLFCCVGVVFYQKKKKKWGHWPEICHFDFKSCKHMHNEVFVFSHERNCMQLLNQMKHITCSHIAFFCCSYGILRYSIILDDSANRKYQWKVFFYWAFLIRFLENTRCHWPHYHICQRKVNHDYCPWFQSSTCKA